jgi:hypothetical protein
MPFASLLNSSTKTLPMIVRFSCGSEMRFDPPLEFLCPINHRQVDPQMPVKRLNDLLTFVQSQKPIINHDSMKSISDSLTHENSRNSRIHTSRDSTNDLRRVAHQMSDPRNFTRQEILHDPTRPHPTNVECKVAQDLDAPRRVVHLGIKLYAENRTRMVGYAGEFAVPRARPDREAFRQLGELIRMGHDHLQSLSQTREQAIRMRVVCFVDEQLGPAIFPLPATRHVAWINAPCNLLT